MEAKERIGKKTIKSQIHLIVQLGDFGWEVDDIINQNKDNEKKRELC